MNLDRRLLLLAREVRLPLGLAVACGLLGGIATILQALFLSQAIDLAFPGHRSTGELSGVMTLLLLSIAVRASLSGMREAAACRTAIRVKARLRERLFAHLLDLGPAHARGERTGELINTVNEGIEALDGYFSQYLPSLALAALVPITILLFVFPLDLISGLIFLVTAPLIPLFTILIGKMAERLTRRQWDSMSQMSAHFLDVLQGLATLKLFGRSRDETRRVERISLRFRDTTMGVLRVAFLSALVLELLATISTAIVAVEVGLRLLYGGIGFQQALFVLILAPEFYLPLRSLGGSFHAALSGTAAAERIFGLLELRLSGSAVGSSHASPPLSVPVPLHSSPPRATASPCPSIVFDDVHYRYDDERQPALKGVSLEIHPGQRVALVGPSGAGKSTLVDLLIRFLDPNQGRILVSGVPLSDIPLDEWRRQLSWLPQSPYLFHTTVEENLRVARPDASREQIQEAARMAGAHDFIMVLPRGYDTIIGERGQRLSGGQAQRIALARAFLKDAPILVLDEAATHLDVEQESLLEGTLGRLMERRTVLMVAHRLSTARRADKVVVLADGRVAERGPHEELIRRGGLYQQMVEAAGSHQLGAVSHQLTAPSLSLTATLSQREGREFESPLPLGEAARRAGEGSPQHSALSTQHIAPDPRPQNLEPRTQTSELGTLLRLLGLMRPLWGWMVLSVLLGFCTVAGGVGLMATAALLIASAALHPSVADLAVPIVGVRFFGLSRGVFRYLERYCSHYATFSLLARLRVGFYQALEPLAPLGLVGQRGGDLLARVVTDVETLQNLFLRVVAPPAVALLVTIAMALFLGAFGPELATPLVAFVLLAGLGVPLLSGRMAVGLGRATTKLGSDLSVQLLDGIQGMADLIAFGQERRRMEMVASTNRRLAAVQRRMAAITGLQSGLTALLSGLGMWAVLTMGIELIGSGRLEWIYLPVVTLAALACFEAVAPLPQAAQQLEGSLEAGRRLFELMRQGETPSQEHGETPPQRHEGTRTMDEPLVSSCLCGSDADGSELKQGGCSLSVSGLSFRYGPEEPPALDGISFDLRQGRSLAIVGPSGAGKSTLLRMLLRLCDYQDGCIRLSGTELRDIPPDKVRRLMAVVPQHTHLFNVTLRENLTLARPDATEEQIEDAASRSQLHNFALGLPRGYDTPVGEQGLWLSAGERQRVAIARALLKDAPILILDEPAAGLDSLTEMELMHSLRQLMVGRTTLLVTHRLVGLEAMDEILVLRGGREVERGSHDTLLRQGGLYRRSWDLQRELLRQE